ncbi:pancreatic triacylglycerol lipase-like [Periplaneta americana]|uniref:pancreatic triacylglycerol lipase-like n=1 Tax=Periplaneta americana TaxID=6978 RepID=UPI0037E87BEE
MVRVSWITLTLLLVVLDNAVEVPGEGSPVPHHRRRSSAIRERIEDRLNARRQEREQARQARKEICYDVVGCFVVSRKISPLKKFPQSPAEVDTRFILFTRQNGSFVNHVETLNISDAQMIHIGDGQKSLLHSNFDPRRPTKLIIHGYMGSGKDRGALSGVDAFLKLGDVNVVSVDWEKGAAGPAYAQSVANTELVGRQTGMLLVDMLTLGARPADIHMVGFSLGAHIAACASHELQNRLLAKVGRITGLDPASPIFRSKLLVEPERKLDKYDAEFVDVIHTDGSPVWTDGFGLLQPLGHVDFFPNGGREQPGCTDGKASVVVSHLERTLDVGIACSHLRAWRLFVESLTLQPGGCRFMAYPCKAGLPSFLQGNCYPALQSCAEGPAESCGLMGINSQESYGRGPLYLVTRDSSPFCGEQLRATVKVSDKTQNTKGILHLVLTHGNSSTNFRIHCNFLEVLQGNEVMWGLAAAEFGTLGPDTTPTMQATLGYQSFDLQQITTDAPDTSEVDAEPLSPKIYLDEVKITDTHGNSWNYCRKDTLLEDKNQIYVDEMTITLSLTPCSA